MVCPPRKCSEEEIKDQLARFSVPGLSPSTPAQNDRIYDVYDPRNGFYAGKVQTFISEDRLTITNVTLPGHVFFDGEIVRHAFLQGGAWYVTTHGWGNDEYFPSWLRAMINEWQGPKIFDYMDQMMLNNIMMHHGHDNRDR
jgi:hypothetical protein